MTAETDAEFVERLYTEYGTLMGKGRDRLFALARRGAAVQWRPISEAPKDGSDIIAWREGHVAKLANWEKEQWDLPAGWSMAEPEFAPTHWMPLPPPPTGETNE